jgi:Na+-transporting methylmalonyl-CoA/oxaloacetate decarboxylase gamma subunit
VDTDAYLAFLGLGLVMIVADGQLLYHSGKRYISDVDSEGEAVGSMARLVTVLFHLVNFGFLALLSVLDFDFGDSGSLRAVVGNLGVLLLLVALVHAVIMAVMSQMHENHASEETPKTSRASAENASTNSYLQRGPVVAPVPGQQGRDPRVSPAIEDQPS